jgi:hypothetical protein
MGLFPAKDARHQESAAVGLVEALCGLGVDWFGAAAEVVVYHLNPPESLATSIPDGVADFLNVPRALAATAVLPISPAAVLAMIDHGRIRSGEVAFVDARGGKVACYSKSFLLARSLMCTIMMQRTGWRG